jgi:hypothetical protein
VLTVRVAGRDIPGADFVELAVVSMLPYLVDLIQKWEINGYS